MDIDKIIQETIQKVSLENEMIKKGINIIEIGKNKKAVCPFHGDTDPSLVLYDGEHPHAHCFGCNKHFDSFWFIHEWGKKEKTNWNIKDTLKYLKDNYGLKISEEDLENDNSFLEKELSISDNSLTERHMIGDYFRISSKIKKHLRKCKYPEKNLNTIKPFLKSLDEKFCNNKRDEIMLVIESINRSIDILEEKEGL